MTQPFRHLIVTRFNTGLYSPVSRARLRPDEWMAHRLRLFETITLPSLAEQDCQSFTWCIGIDPATPDADRQRLERLCAPQSNIRIVVPQLEQDAWLSDIEPGPYDLLTTRIDNDDALHHDAVATLHETYRTHAEQMSRPWVMVFPFGAILDVPSRRAWIMEYWFNNTPTAVENRDEAETIWRWQHDRIPAEVPRCYIKDKPYWLQVVHDQNIINAVDSPNPNRKVHKHIAVRPEHLTLFGVDPGRLPTA